MGSNIEMMQEELEKKDENNNNIAKFPELKQVEIFVASKLSDRSDAEVEEKFKELGDSGVKQDQESLKDIDEEMVDLFNNNTATVMEEKEIETLSSEFSDICTKELGTNGGGDDSLVNNNNNTAMVQEEEIEAFSGVLSDSDVTRVTKLIECDPFLYQVVDSFLKLKSDR